MGARALAGLAVVVACVPPGQFPCGADAECDGGGFCERTGYCSFPDGGCDSGRRYSRYAPEDIASECTDPSAVGWWNTDWARRRRLTFANAEREGALVRFPVLVALDPARVDYAQTAELGADLRFVDNDAETLLPHEVELWEPGGTSLVWVEVGRVEGGSADDFVYMYYGNLDPVPLQTGPPWSEGYAGVWHLGEDLDDRTGLANAVTGSGTMPVPGQIGGATAFARFDDSLSAGSPPALADVFDGGGTASAWINPTGFDGAAYRRILDKAADEDSNTGFALLLTNDGTGVNTVRFTRGFSGAHSGWNAQADAIAFNAWQFVAVTYDSTVASNTPVLYVDGQQVDIVATDVGDGEPVSDVDFPLVIGNTRVANPVDTRAFLGSIDEVRVARTLRTRDWLAAQYQVGIDAFVTFEPEESLD